MTHEHKHLVKRLGEKLWLAANELRGHVDLAEYKHIVLRLVFLKYISDVFQERSPLLLSIQDANQNNPEKYILDKVIWVPEQARWSFLQERANSSEICTLIDNAFAMIEEGNSTLKGVLSKNNANSTVNARCISGLIDLISNIETKNTESFSKDILVRIYEYFLEKFANAEGKNGGEFYTPQSVVKLLVEMLEPYKGRIYDPCCGAGGMFVQAEKFVQSHGGQISDISIYGQESIATTWQICKMNLVVRDIEADLGQYPENTFHNDLHKDLKADFILANPPFNMSNWGGERLRQDMRWKYGIPPTSNANFAWVQHFISHLADNGIAGFVLSNSSMSSNRSGEEEIRKSIIEADLVDCMVALPGQLFYATQIPVCLWFLTNNKTNGKFRDRQGQTLFIDARKQGYLVNRIRREFLDDEISHMAQIYHAWRGEPDAGIYKDILGFCKSVTKEEIAAHGYILTPGQYVGTEEIEKDDEPFAEKLAQLTMKLEEQFTESKQLETLIKESLERLTYDQ